ncbi:MAG: cyclic nucleotide-binding domain-containing protein [Xenococcaceae cyanobacterium]
MLKPAKTVELFQKQPDPMTFSAGEVIFKEGQLGDVMYGIIEGEVDMLVNGQVIETIKRGDVFGEGALLHPEGARYSTAIAKTDCQLAFLDEGRFLFAIQQTPIFSLQVMKSYSDRFRRLKHLL